MIKVTEYKKIVDYFIALSNETGNLLSNLKLQKLLYYAQAWHLAYFETRLFEGTFQAWVHGPVLPEVYSELRHFGWRPIAKDSLNQEYIEHFCNEIVSPEQCELLQDVVDEYFGLTAFELEKLTHSEKPWQLARTGLAKDEPSDNIISDRSMIEYYKEFLVSG